jgi:proteic killer suppression protein
MVASRRCAVRLLKKGKLKGRWSIWVNGNWRLTFAFEEGDAHLIDYEDYH